MKSKKKNLVPILILILLGISLGYALLTQDLTINGTTKVAGNTWDIHFDNIVVNSNSVTLSTGDSAATINASDDTLVEYTVTLNVPGDFYEFTVDAVNEGTVDGMIDTITSKLNNVAISTTNPLPSYLDYTVTYSDGTVIAPNHILAAGTTETYKVRVEFKRDIENNQLPTTDQTNTFSLGIEYVQSDSNVIPVPHPITYTYAYATSSTLLSIGSAISNGGVPTYDSYQEAIDAFRHPVFIAHTLANGIITESRVGFIYNSNLYLLQGGIDEGGKLEQPVYEANKAVLDSAFGSANCEEDTENVTNYLYYSCLVGNEGGTVYAIGYVYAYSEYNWDCYVYSDGSSNCYG